MNEHFWKVWLPPHVFLVGCAYLSSFTWSVAISAFVFYCLISGLGIAVGFHRYFSHKSFRTSKFWEQVMLFFGVQACHGNPVFWIALHRGHHKHSDTDKDIHSPLRGLITAYQGYAFDKNISSKVSLRLAIDFMRRKDFSWSVEHYGKVVFFTRLAILLISILCCPFLIYGFLIAQVWAIHQEAIVNVLGHVSGFGSYRLYETDDSSVNRNLLGLVTWGQSLHNNHHWSQTEPDFAKGLYEFDPSMIWIKLLQSDPKIDQNDPGRVLIPPADFATLS